MKKNLTSPNARVICMDLVVAMYKMGIRTVLKNIIRIHEIQPSGGEHNKRHLMGGR